MQSKGIEKKEKNAKIANIGKKIKNTRNAN